MHPVLPSERESWSLSPFSTPSNRCSTDDAEFHAQASGLVDQYIPSDVWPSITSALVSAASAANVQVTPDARAVFIDEIEKVTPDAWFAASAVPQEYSSQVAALESAVDELRPLTVTLSVSVSSVETVVPVTTTGADGKVSTTSVSTTVLSSETVTYR